MTCSWTRKFLCAVASTAAVALFPSVSKKMSSSVEVLPVQGRRSLQQRFEPATVVQKGPPGDPATVVKGPERGVRKLEFVHITKNGGSAIETAAAKVGVIWGACHYKEWKNLGCDGADWPTQFNKMLPPEGDKRYHGEPWHAPHYWLDPPVYGDAATFAVIRDPYDRIISEYHYFEGAINGVSEDPAKMNTWIVEKLDDFHNKAYYGGHFLPQHYFVYDSDGKQKLDHVVRYENLNEEFAALMKVYKLPIVLPEKKRRFRNKSNKYYTKEHLSDSTIGLINKFYGEDFKLLGYPMVNKAVQFKSVA